MEESQLGADGGEPVWLFFLADARRPQCSHLFLKTPRSWSPGVGLRCARGGVGTRLTLCPLAGSVICHELVMKRPVPGLPGCRCEGQACGSGVHAAGQQVALETCLLAPHVDCQHLGRHLPPAPASSRGTFSRPCPSGSRGEPLRGLLAKRGALALRVALCRGQSAVRCGPGLVFSACCSPRGRTWGAAGPEVRRGHPAYVRAGSERLGIGVEIVLLWPFG